MIPIQRRLYGLVSRFARIGADLQDTDELRLRKSVMAICSFMIIPAGIIWGLIYLAFGEPLAGALPLTYSLLSSLSLVIFALTRRYRFFRLSQLLLILLAPFLLMVVLGGFVNSSAVILWSLLCPLGALLFDDSSTAPPGKSKSPARPTNCSKTNSYASQGAQ